MLDGGGEVVDVAIPKMMPSVQFEEQAVDMSWRACRALYQFLGESSVRRSGDTQNIPVRICTFGNFFPSTS